MRFDFFMIWGNSVANSPHICSMIREDSNFEIVRIVLIGINDMPSFIEGIYGCDHVPIEHLRGKTRYLLQGAPCCMLVLVRNKEPEELYFGEGEFRHIQCAKVKLLKERIRNKFNPRFTDVNKRIPPLDTGVSHDHCVHASDYESQVDYVLSFLQMESTVWHNRNEDLPFNVTWHVDIGDNYKKVNKSLSELHANVMMENGSTQNLEISQTPHYMYVQGNPAPYLNYVDDHLGRGLQEDHWPQKFDLLINNFDPDYRSDNGKSSPIVITSDGRIIDGLHRAAIMQSIGVDFVECIQI